MSGQSGTITLQRHLQLCDVITTEVVNIVVFVCISCFLLKLVLCSVWCEFYFLCFHALVSVWCVSPVPPACVFKPCLAPLEFTWALSALFAHVWPQGHRMEKTSGWLDVVETHLWQLGVSAEDSEALAQDQLCWQAPVGSTNGDGQEGPGLGSGPPSRPSTRNRASLYPAGGFWLIMITGFSFLTLMWFENYQRDACSSPAGQMTQWYPVPVSFSTCLKWKIEISRL